MQGPLSTDTLLRKIEDGSLHLGVIGMGYVGLPLALTFVEQTAFRVTGFDTDPQKVQSLQASESYIVYIGVGRVASARATGRFDATADLSRLGEPDVLLICVPTPLTPSRTPELKYVKATAEAIRQHLRPAQLVILESTTYPGTTDELLRGILERDTGLVAGRDFWLAYSPEREDPGNRKFNTASIPKVVGGLNPESTELAVALYAKAINRVVAVSSARVAEATKLTENIFRSVNIALVNELKVIYDAMGIDIGEVLDAADTKPFGFMKFSPGPGLGGHCVPLDPFYLAWKARQFGLVTRFIELAGEINTQMPQYVLGKLKQALHLQNKSVQGSKVLMLGLAYKKDIDDCRESPAFPLLAQLLELGANVCYHDPYIPSSPSVRSWPNLPMMNSQPLSPQLLSACDAAILVTDHTSVDYALVASHAPLIVDTRGVYRDRHAPNIVRA